MKRVISAKSYIQAHARSRSDVEDKLEDNTVETLQHLAYLYVFPNVQDTNHWRSEVWKFFHRMPRVRIGKKVRFLKKQEFLSVTFNLHKSDYELEAILTGCPILEPRYTPEYDKINNIEGFRSICAKYFDWLSDEITREGVVRAADCYTTLQNLGL